MISILAIWCEGLTTQSNFADRPRTSTPAQGPGQGSGLGKLLPHPPLGKEPGSGTLLVDLEQPRPQLQQSPPRQDLIDSVPAGSNPAMTEASTTSAVLEIKIYSHVTTQGVGLAVIPLPLETICSVVGPRS